MGSLFKPKTPKPPKMAEPKPPELPAPTRMPTLASSSVQEEKRKRLAMAYRRTGRRSTILTDQDGNGTLGGLT